ncbi:MAG: hypothetical protein JXQ83_13125 [Candidatus Glassbacteria bacterium]|nr:hypothetical protein [Candidatus Glassbacteria bacterium]
MDDVIPINLAVEDDLSEMVARKLLLQSGRPYQVGTCYGKRGKDYLKKTINGWNNAARGTPFLVLSDLDRCECAPRIIDKWLARPVNENLIFRIAVREVEAWLFAHKTAFASFLGVRQNLLPDNPDEIDYPKRKLIEVSSRSKKREIREAIVPAPGSTARKGPAYNAKLISFVYYSWDVNEALKTSPSLKKAFNSIKNFSPKHLNLN